MLRRITSRVAPAVVLVAAALSASPPAHAAVEPVEPTSFFLPAGQGCPDFNLGVDQAGGNVHSKEFIDENGEVVRTITAGKGFDVTYTNYGPDPENAVAGESVTIKTAGAVTRTVVNPDGTQTVFATGHNGLILFPSDVPAGPTTTQYIGRIVYSIDPATGVFTLMSTTGQERDICAELAQ